MKSREIEKLLERFYSGETSLEEERYLKEFFASHEVPPHLMAEKLQFMYMSAESGKELKDEEFDQQVLKKVASPEGLLEKFMVRKNWFYATAGVAASILILLAIFIRFDPFPKKMHDTYSDPEMAYAEAKKVLLFVSGKFNNGTEKLKPITTYDDGMKELKTVSALNEGINAVGKLKKYNKIEQMMETTN